MQYDLHKIRKTPFMTDMEKAFSAKDREQLSLDQRVKYIENTMKETAKDMKRERKAKKVWISKETLDLVSTRRNLKVKRKTPEDYEQYRQCCKEVKKSARNDKRQWISDRCKDIEEKVGGAKDREGCTSQTVEG